MSEYLVVDDSRVSRMMISAIIKQEEPGSLVVEAENGEQALSLSKGKRFDLMILDYNMPGIDGLTLAQQLRSEHPGCKISLLTANVQQATREKAAQMDVQFCAKPITEEKIVSLLKQRQI